MNINFNKKIILLLLFSEIIIYFDHEIFQDSFKIINASGFTERIHKYWVGEIYKIVIKNFQLKKEIIKIFSENNKVEIFNDTIIMKTSGRECLITETKKNNFSKCFNIYNTPNLSFNEKSPFKLETNSIKQLNLNYYDYPLSRIKYMSNHPKIINVDKEGKITAIRPGNAIITAFGLDNKNSTIKVISMANNGFLNNFILDKHNASQYKKVMIVAHPDDETLWGGANLYKDNFFVVCITNAYNLKRSRDFRELIKIHQ